MADHIETEAELKATLDFMRRNANLSPSDMWVKVSADLAADLLGESPVEPTAKMHMSFRAFDLFHRVFRGADGGSDG